MFLEELKNWYDVVFNLGTDGDSSIIKPALH